jgi:HAD superfamily hydrolase (TIGR01490 family)
VKKQILVLFDFDGTLSRSDSMFKYAKFVNGPFRYYLGLLVLMPIFILLFVKILNNSKAKEIFLIYFFGGKSLEELQVKAVDFTHKVLIPDLYPGAIEEIEKYRTDVYKVLIVSASADLWLIPFAKYANVELICTHLEVKNGKITGKLSSPNCYGPQKVDRIKQYLDLSQFERIIAYGDSSGDKQMLELAHETFYKPFSQIKTPTFLMF